MKWVLFFHKISVCTATSAHNILSFPAKGVSNQRSALKHQFEWNKHRLTTPYDSMDTNTLTFISHNQLHATYFDIHTVIWFDIFANQMIGLCIRKCIYHWFIYHISVCCFSFEFLLQNFNAIKIQRNKILLTKSKFSFLFSIPVKFSLAPQIFNKKNYIKLHHDTHNLKKMKKKTQNIIFNQISDKILRLHRETWNRRRPNCIWQLWNAMFEMVETKMDGLSRRTTTQWLLAAIFWQELCFL